MINRKAFLTKVVEEGFRNKISGYPLTLKHSKGRKLLDYKIYGNSVQDGTPTTETPIEIQSVGDKTKNLFDPNAPSEQGFINGKTGGINKNSNYPSVYIYTFEVKPNTTYTYYHSIRNNPTYSLYDKDMNWLNKAGGYAATSGTISPVTFTTTEETKYVKICISKNKVDEGKGRLNEGTTLIDEPYGYKIPVTVSGKNLISYPYTFLGTDNSGLTVTDNKDGSITINGTASKIVYFHIVKHYGDGSLKLPVGKYIISDNKSDSSAPNFAAHVRKNNADVTYVVANKENNVLTINDTNYDYIWISITIQEGTVFNNVTYRPQLESGSQVTNYELYKKPKTTNIYLNEPLRKVGDYADYIDFKNKKVVRNVKVNDNTGTKTIEESYTQQDPKIEETIELPEILTHKGTNIITVDTTIEPSKIEATYSSFEKEVS